MVRPLPGSSGDRHRLPSPSWKESLARWGRTTLAIAASTLATYLGVCIAALGMYAMVFPPVTGVQLQREVDAVFDTGPTGHTYEPVPLSQIDPTLPLAVVAAEDSRFFRHSGIDWTEIGKALRAYRRGGKLRGASSITQQLVKNLFLTTHSTVFRKALEVPLTYAAELLLSKRRILELYVNVIEWGPGVFGVRAATHYHYGTSPRHLTRAQAAALAACIPNPLARRPQTVGYYQRVILDRMTRLAPLPLSDVDGPGFLPPSSVPAPFATIVPRGTAGVPSFSPNPV